MSAVPASPTPPHRGLIPVLIVVVSLMVGGGLLAREIYRQPESQPPAILALPSSPARPLSQQPGPATVELTPDSAEHPQHEVVRTLVQAYFDAINSRDYDAWRGTVTKARSQAKPRAGWLSDFRTTKDGSILVYRIDTLSDQDLRVFLGFTSTQDPSDAPPELPEPCVRWNIVLPLTQETGVMRVDMVSGGNTELSRC